MFRIGRQSSCEIQIPDSEVRLVAKRCMVFVCGKVFNRWPDVGPLGGPESFDVPFDVPFEKPF